MNGKQLKNSILQWAIQGKLVPQDPNDKPASVLLEKIRAEKARLVKEGKIKKDKKESIIYRGEDNSYYEKFADGKVVCIDEEIPFEIPESWSFVRLGVICNYLHRGKTPKYGNQKILPIIAQKCNHWDQLYIDRCLFSAIDYILKYKEEQFLQKGDIIINSTGGGTVGRTGYIDATVFEKFDKFVADSHVTIVRPNKLVSHRYIYHYLLSPYIQIGIEERCTGSTNQIELRTTTISDYLVPIPPVEEQKRIVEKVESMLPVVTRYQKLQSNLEHLNSTLFPQIKKSILQEAVQGKLIPQDPNDEPASVLLQRIKEEKKRLVKEGKLKKKDVVDSVIYKGDDNKYYEQVDGTAIQIESDYDFPNTWAVVKLSHICRLIDGAKKEGQHICLDAKYLRGKSTGAQLNKGKFVAKGNNIILVDGENSGEVFTVPHDGYMGSTFKQLWISNCMYLSYVLYFILFYKDLLRNSKKGAAIPHLNKDTFYSLVVGIPPYQEQKRIANRIEEIINKIKD